MPKTIFISRDLDSNSPLAGMSKDGTKVYGQSLIDIVAQPFTMPQEFDWIFFYSQHGVRAFFAGLTERLEKHLYLAAFGPKTAALVRYHQHKVAFTGNGKATPTARAFKKIAANQVVLFARASNSLRSVQKQLGDDIRPIDLVVYSNSPKTNFNIPRVDTLIFTSPLNARAFLAEQEIEESQQVIAIGESTASELSKTYSKSILIPEVPSEEALVNLILHLENG